MHIDHHRSFESDLDSLWQVDPAAAAAVVVTLELVESDIKALDKLTTHGDVSFDESLMNIKLWKSIGVQKNLWRFRALNTPATNYRVIYGYHYQTKQLCLLALVNKDGFDYDDHNSEIVRRIVADWKAITS